MLINRDQSNRRVQHFIYSWKEMFKLNKIIYLQSIDNFKFPAQFHVSKKVNKHFFKISLKFLFISVVEDI